MMNVFEPAESRWIERLANLRNVIRQEVIARQLAEYARPGVSVLDVGCGQGTQALRCAERGCRVTGVDPSKDLLDLFAISAAEFGLDVELITGEVDGLEETLGQRHFDLVCSHGLLMYMEDRAGTINLARRVAPNGKLSITFRNGHALAMRPGLRHQWSEAIAAFNSCRYTNELGLPARADRIEAVSADLADAGMHIVEWFGVRVFNEAIAAGAVLPNGDELDLLLEAEDLAGRRDPYRWMAAQFHVIANRYG